MTNARRLNRDDLVFECLKRLAHLAGRQYDEVLEREFWSAVVLAEEIKTIENGKTTLLSRTRQKYGRDGARKCIEDLATANRITDGFLILTRHGRADLTFEGVVLRHSEKFEDHVVEVARSKLLANGVDAGQIEAWSNGET